MRIIKSKVLIIALSICLVVGAIPLFSLNARASQVKEVPVYWEYWYDHGGGDGGQGDWFVMSWESKTVIKRCKDANNARVTISDNAPYTLDNIDYVVISTYKYSIYDSFKIELRFKNLKKPVDLGNIVVELPTTDNRIKSIANGNEYLTINMDRSGRPGSYSSTASGYIIGISERTTYRLPADKERTFTASQFTNEEADSVFLGYHQGWSITKGSANIDSHKKTITLDNCVIAKDLYNYGNRERWTKFQVIENNKVVDVYGPECGYEMCFGQKTNGDYATANDSTLINIKGNCELNKPDQLGDYVQPFRIITESGYKLKIKCEPKSSLKINGYDEYFNEYSKDSSELKAFTKEHIELLDNTVFDEETCTIRNAADMVSDKEPTNSIKKPANNAKKPASQKTKVGVVQSVNNVGESFTIDASSNIRCYNKDGSQVKNDFKCDGTYTYYFQADGTAMKDRLTYHPDGVHVIYFDGEGHEVFSNFAHVKKSIANTDVDDFCFFDVYGHLYVDVLTYDQAGQHIYYANPYGVMEVNKWFQFSNNVKWADGTPAEANKNQYGFANYDGTLATNSWTYDFLGRWCYLQGNGVALY